jgi:hypothetical protein
MTRYLCTDPSHGRGDEITPVDLTARVRTELGYLSRGAGAVRSTTGVIDRVAAVSSLDRQERARAIREILTGSADPSDTVVTLIAEPRPEAPPRPEVDLASERVTQRVAAGGTSRSEGQEVIRLPEADPRSGAQAEPDAEGRFIPSGTYLATELAARVAAAAPEREAIIDAIERTPSYEEQEVDTLDHPWRVVVGCPRAEGDPPTRHKVVFAGTGEPTADVVFGTPAAGWDLVLEDAVGGDLAPPLARRRAERLLVSVVLVEVVVGLALLAIGWASGGLGLAAREAPGWLGVSVALALGALAVGLVAIVAPREADGNSNDMLVVDAFYRSRSTMLWTATILSASAFLLAVLLAVVPAMTARETALPAPSVTFDTVDGVDATVTLTVADIGTDDLVRIDVLGFTDPAAAPTSVGLVTTSGGADGTAEIEETFALDPGLQTLAVAVSIDAPTPTCGPSGASGAGCTVVPVPPASTSTG